MKLLLSLLLLLSFVSCEELTGEYTGADKIEAQAKNPDAVIKKIGKLQFVSVADKFRLDGVAKNGGHSAHSFSTKTKLTNHKELTLYFFATKHLESSLVIKIVRNDLDLELTATLDNATYTHVIEDFDFQEANSFLFDIHNDHDEGIHFFIWKEGQTSTSLNCSFDETCLFNSEDFILDFTDDLGRAQGSYWGISGDVDGVKELKGFESAIYKH